MSSKVIICGEKNISEKIWEYFKSNNGYFENVIIADSFETCIAKIQSGEANIIIFQLLRPIYKTQNFFMDLIEADLSPILLAFTINSEKEIIYSMTTESDYIIMDKLKNCFTTSLQDTYRFHFNYIGSKESNNHIMSTRVKKLEKVEYMNDILRGVTQEEFNYYKKKAEIDLNNSGYYLYVCNLMDFEYVDHDLNKNIYFLVGEILIDECQEVLNTYRGGEVFYINPTRLCIIINDVPLKSQAQYQQMLSELTNKINNVTQCRTSLRYMSYYIHNIEDVRIAYESFYHLKIYNFFCHEAEVLTFEYIEKVKKDFDYSDVDSYLQEIKSIIHHNVSNSKLIEIMKNLFLNVIKPSLSYNLYYYCYTFITAAFVDKFQEFYPTRLLNNETPQELFYFSIEQKLNELIELVFMIKADSSHQHLIKSPVVYQAIELINKFYSDDISIYFIAEQLNITHSYLSQKFTKEMGISPRKYLITYRIKKAKEMLSAGAKPVYLIASDVGYLDVKHFSKTFKKETGLSPLQYKKSIPEKYRGE
ncbi:AraC family transcriptional regulator [Salibacterium salarium]|uniref:AraC family transcriptional regulator n=1 Tax=Salibacterium salarium TaxID=284579 RepID=A0A3R9RB73_9BACI|nr:AraC family transcriptional regulator [Salibacterium salarium]RSL31455.1 AraC family transcriptional regulator [Salibacterium salarium]